MVITMAKLRMAHAAQAAWANNDKLLQLPQRVAHTSHLDQKLCVKQGGLSQATVKINYKLLDLNII